MHLTRDIGTNAAAIMAGMAGRDFAECECGVVEQYAMIGKAAEFLAQHEAAIGDLLEGGFPGVFAYEVAEELGSWMNDFTDTRKPIEFDGPAKSTAINLMAEFFLGNLSSKGQPVHESNRQDYETALGYLSSVLPGDWTPWYERLEVVEKQPTETVFTFQPIIVPWVVGDVVFQKDSYRVRKGEIKRIVVGQSQDTSGKNEMATSMDVLWAGATGVASVYGLEVDRLYRTAEEAFA